MQSVRNYEAQGAGQELATPGRARGIKSLFASQTRRGKASATPNALQPARAPVQTRATGAVSQGASARSQGKTGLQLDLARTQLQSCSAVHLQQPASRPSQAPASHAGAHCVVTWQPLQVSAPGALDSAQDQGLKDTAQDQSCRPAVKAEPAA